jgi:hypothetical protein
VSRRQAAEVPTKSRIAASIRRADLDPLTNASHRTWRDLVGAAGIEPAARGL